MTNSGRVPALASLCAIPVFLIGAAAAGQEHDPAPNSTAVHRGATAHDYHRNHFGGLLGVSVHLDNNDSAFALGLEYARQISPSWAVAGYVESVSSDIERDLIVAGGVVYYPLRRLGLVVAPGLESATKDVEHHGEVEREYETEFLVRFGAAYGFSVTPQASLGPALFADRAGNRWTLVVGLGTVVGF